MSAKTNEIELPLLFCSDDLIDVGEVTDEVEAEFKFAKLKIIYDAGNLSALYDAILFAKNKNLPLPDWSNKALVGAFEAFFEQSKTELTGRHARWITQH